VRVFLDTNVLLSAFFGRGLCAQLFEALLESDHGILIGEPVARELVRIAREKFKVSDVDIGPALEVLRRQRLAPPADRDLAGIPHSDDAPILACALTAKADLFVTGDRALLALGRVEGLPLVDPRSAWMRLFSGT
jgi:putative PIN family toxin of toxin-antitoxin system